MSAPLVTSQSDTQLIDKGNKVEGLKDDLFSFFVEFIDTLVDVNLA